MTLIQLRQFFFAALLLLVLPACKPDHADMLFINGVIHTQDPSGTIAQAIAIRGGKIIAVGNSDDLQFRFGADTIINLEGRAVYPGFIDPHSHFLGYAKFLNQADLTGSATYEEVLQRVDSFAKTLQPNEWILGRGWDQNDWPEKRFPTNAELNEKYPDQPVVLYRIDGHAMLCNAAALREAGINNATYVDGGSVFTEGGVITGVLLDNAMTLIKDVMPIPDEKVMERMVRQAQANCFRVGLTSVSDAGLSKADIFLLDSLQKKGILKLRVYAMADPTEDNLDYFLKSGPLKTDRLHMCSFKAYADGALGSRGAALLEPYKDDPGNVGLLLQQEEYFEELAGKLYAAKFQMNTHCIGDRAVRMILNVYSHHVKPGDDRRWRIEHAQVVNQDDFHLFGDFDIWPSVQPIHAMSDQPWAENRIGKERLLGAYAYKQLMAQNGKIAFGSDFPVEDINPIYGFHAAVARIRRDGQPYGGYMPEQAVGRDTAMRAMTIWAAEANFEEKEKGSIEPGKWADFVVLDVDIMFAPIEEVPDVKVRHTIVAGEIVYTRK